MKIKTFFKQNWQIVVIFCVALVLRLVFLGLRSLDGDEGVIIKVAQSTDLKAMFAAVAKDVHPPLLHIFEYLDLKIFPLNEFWARFPSAIFSTLVVFPIYGVFKLISDKKTALWVCVLSVFAAVLAYHGQEIRPYALLTLVFFCQLYFLLLAVKKKSFWPIFWFGIFSLLLVLTQYIGFIVLVGEGIYVLTKGGKARWPLILGAIGAVVIFILTWGSQLLNQLSGRTGEQSQALNLKNNLTGIFNAIYRFGAGRLFLDLDPSISRNLQFIKDSPLLFTVFVLSVILVFGLFIWGSVLLFKKNKNAFWLSVSVILPLVLAAMVSAEIGPRSVRYLSFLAPFYLFIVFQTYSGRMFAKICFGSFLLIFLIAFINGFYFEKTRVGTKEIAQYLNDNANKQDAVLIRGGYGGGEELALRYYLKNRANDFVITDLYGDYKVGNLSQIKARNPVDYINKLKITNGKIWYYDFTYSTNESLLPKPFTKTDLGKDKEGKDLILYSF